MLWRAIRCQTFRFPVDTQVFHATKRLGWIPPNATYEKDQQILVELTPPHRYYPLHIDLIRHGREICPLTEVYEYYQTAQPDSQKP